MDRGSLVKLISRSYSLSLVPVLISRANQIQSYDKEPKQQTAPLALVWVLGSRKQKEVDILISFLSIPPSLTPNGDLKRELRLVVEPAVFPGMCS